MSEQMFLVLTTDDDPINNIEFLNALTQELGQNLTEQDEVIQRIDFVNREALPVGTKMAEFAFAQQIILQLLPVVTPWALDKVGRAVKSLQGHGPRIFAKVRIGSNEVKITPKTTQAELDVIKQQLKATTAPSSGNRRALVIGNSQYQDPNLAELKSPTIDAHNLAEVLSDPELGAFAVDKPLINANSNTIKQAIERFFNQAAFDDLLLLYFSGHGIRDRAGKLYLAAHDTVRDVLRSTGISSRFINDIMNGSPSKRQILILDCCYGGAIVEGAKSDQIIGQPVHTTANFHSTGYGRITITASDAMQYAFDGQDVQGTVQNSIFTRYLIEGIRTGKADTDNDGYIDIQELYQYAHQKVTPRQTPNISTEQQKGRILIARNPNPIIRPVQLPDSIKRAIESDDRLYRQGAVYELAQMLRSNDDSAIMAAEIALRELLMDDSNSVRKAAHEALAQHAAPPQQKSSPPQPVVQQPLREPPIRIEPSSTWAPQETTPVAQVPPTPKARPVATSPVKTPAKPKRAQANLFYCQYCGHGNAQGTAVCTNCGRTIGDLQPSKKKWSWFMMLLLVGSTIFIPFFGSFIGIIVGGLNLRGGARKNQAVGLLLLGIIRLSLYFLIGL